MVSLLLATALTGQAYFWEPPPTVQQVFWLPDEKPPPKPKPRLTPSDLRSMQTQDYPRPRYEYPAPPVIYYSRPGVLRYRLYNR